MIHEVHGVGLLGQIDLDDTHPIIERKDVGAEIGVRRIDVFDLYQVALRREIDLEVTLNEKFLLEAAVLGEDTQYRRADVGGAASAEEAAEHPLLRIREEEPRYVAGYIHERVCRDEAMAIAGFAEPGRNEAVGPDIDGHRECPVALRSTPEFAIHENFSTGDRTLGVAELHHAGYRESGDVCKVNLILDGVVHAEVDRLERGVELACPERGRQRERRR